LPPLFGIAVRPIVQGGGSSECFAVAVAVVHEVLTHQVGGAAWRDIRCGCRLARGERAAPKVHGVLPARRTPAPADNASPPPGNGFSRSDGSIGPVFRS